MKCAILMLHEKYNTLKINYQTIKHEIKVQALKDTSWMKPRYLVTFFFVLKVLHNHSYGLLVESFCFAWLSEGLTFHIAGWMKKGLRRKWICCSNCILLNLNNVCSDIKKEMGKSKLSMTDWPCHIWFGTDLGDRILCTLSPDHKIHGGRGGMEFISNEQCVVWSQKMCWKCIFQQSEDPNFKKCSLQYPTSAYSRK